MFITMRARKTEPKPVREESPAFVAIVEKEIEKQNIEEELEYLLEEAAEIQTEHRAIDQRIEEALSARDQTASPLSTIYEEIASWGFKES